MQDSSNTSPLCRTFANFRRLKDWSSEDKGSARNARAAKQRRCETPSWICTIPESVPTQLVHCGCSAERVGERGHVISLGPPKQESFEKIKKLVSEAPVLQYYDVSKPAKIQCDASGKGLRAVLLQDDKPVCYASRALTGAESRYASIEAEMLAVVFACRKFHQYIYGKRVVVETDHKPLQAISTKPLSQAPLRLQRMLLNFRGYDVEIRYNPGCKQVLADTLSRAAVPTGDSEAYEEFQEINMVLSVSEERYEEFQKETKVDPELQAVLTMVRNGWPDTKQQVPLKARPYWTFRDDVTTADGSLVKMADARAHWIVNGGEIV